MNYQEHFRDCSLINCSIIWKLLCLSVCVAVWSISFPRLTNCWTVWSLYTMVMKRPLSYVGKLAAPWDSGLYYILQLIWRPLSERWPSLRGPSLPLCAHWEETFGAVARARQLQNSEDEQLWLLSPSISQKCSSKPWSSPRNSREEV